MAQTGMTLDKPTYQELEQRLAEAEAALASIRRGLLTSESNKDSAITAAVTSESYQQNDTESSWQTLEIRSFLNAFPDGIMVLKPEKDGGDFIIMQINPNAEEISSIKNDLVVGRKLLDVFPYARSSGLLDVLQRVKKTGNSEFECVTHFSKEDQDIWHINNIFMSHNGDLIRIYQDFSDRQRFHEKLLESQRTLEMLMGNLPGMVFRRRHDPNWTILFVSDGCRNLTGYTADALIQNAKVSYHHLILAEYRDQVEQEIQDAIEQNRSYQVRYPICTAQDEIRWVWEQGQISQTISSDVIEGFITDISDRHRAEFALEESEERFRLAFQTNPNIEFILRVSDLTIVDANFSFTSILGFKYNEVIGKNLNELGILQKEDALVTKFQSSTREYIGVRDIEIQFQVKTGELRRGLISASSIMDNKVAQLLVVIHDIEEHKSTLDQLRSSKERYKELSNSINDVFFAIDEKYAITYWNHASEHLTGLPASEAEGTPAFKVFPELQTWFEDEALLANQNDPNRTVINYHHENGIVHLECTIYPTKTGFSVFARDITLERKKDEDERRFLSNLMILSETAAALVEINSDTNIYHLIAKKMEALVPNAIICVLQYDMQNQSFYFQDILGAKSLEDLSRSIGMDVFNVSIPSESWVTEGPLSKDTAFIPADEIAMFFSKEMQFALQFFQEQQDNYDIPGIFTITLTRSQTLYGMGVIIPRSSDNLPNIDILRTLARVASVALQRRQTELELHQSEQKLASFIRQSTDGLILISEQGDVLEWSQGQESITARTSEEVRKNKIWELHAQMLPPGLMNDSILEDVKNRIERLQMSSYFPMINHPREVQLMRRDGNLRTVQLSLFPIQTNKGHRVGAIARDITLERRHQQEMEAIVSINKALRSTSTRKDIITAVLEELSQLLRIQGTVLTTFTANHPENRFEMGWGVWQDLTGKVQPGGVGITARVIQNAEVYIRENLKNQPDPELVDMPLHKNLDSVACIPLNADNQIIGTLWVGKDDAFDPQELRTLNIVADIAANAINRATLHDQRKRRLDHITALRKIDQTIVTSLDLRVNLRVLLDQVIDQLKVDAADILLYNPISQMLEYGEGRGFHSLSIQNSRVAVGQGQAGRAALEGQMIFLPNLQKTGDHFTRNALLTGENFVSYLSLPLIAKGKIRGVLELFHRSRLDPDMEWLGYLDNLGGQAAILIDSNEMYNDLQRSNAELMLAYNTTLEGWVRALDMRDQETEGHTKRVTEITIQLASHIKLPNERLIHLYRGALLHDIGKMAVPDNILRKPGPLNKEELEIMHRHPIYAYELLRPIPFLEPSLDIPYCHHERWDGKGYPRGLKGDAIPLVARIFAVVDVWDALRSDRPYRKGWPDEHVIQYIRSKSGEYFDPWVVNAFMEMIGK